TEGPYHTELPTPEEIHQFLQFERVDSNRIIKSKKVTLSPNQVLTKELRHDLKRWNKLIYEYVFGLGGHQDHLPACFAHILYCILAEQQYNLAYFFVKRIESERATPKAHIPYGMFFTRLFRHVMEHHPYLENGIYDVVERVMRPLALRQARRPRSDREKPVTLSLQLSPIITVDLHLVKKMMRRMMTPSTKDTSSSSIDYTPKSPTSSTSPPTNGYLNSPTSPPPRVPPPLPTQENISMDITLTLSPITLLDVQFDTPSPSLPIFGHPIPWNLLETHGDSCLCCIHNRTLIFRLRDELQCMFSHIEYMLSQPPPSNSPPTPSLSPN
nr:ribosomal protein L7Ae/L30e/S12e/Gadd45 [Tanacetum cinerariifolium]